MWTGKKSLYLTEAGHDFWYVWKKNYWLPVLFLILFLILIPFSTAGLPGDSMFNLEYTHDQVKYRFFMRAFGSRLWPGRWLWAWSAV